ncbi:serine-threonine/tyrosine-protein kinase catalytic domain, cGMP-dependent kinase [Artemisia annua]|uniref:Serine-threonine/tyrosine-protein kinase catalytic domain, cGMP-dependent kinase n=1 Tax=Artemisia annua TaxID=35608 RepID=A0A2U1L273_ARTAN|nr:serine-threonine/tyrosine-protein kinase catalytic domain, cGMP-dependent kinase [Artemisia annua]
MSFMDDLKYLKISLKCIQAATNNFGDKPIGSGGFGDVYKGELILQKGARMVAFKRLNRKFGQGDVEFWKEIILLSELKHKNLATLLHFCNEDKEILVYMYASRGSLDKYLGDTSLTWTQHLDISNRCLNRDHKERPHMVEVVKELEAAIHQQQDASVLQSHGRVSTPQNSFGRYNIGHSQLFSQLSNRMGRQKGVIHRNITSANILLDENWSAKITDFGMSKVVSSDEPQTDHIDNIVGTIGYCDLSYMETGIFSKKSDVYSFGVVLFEVMCGRLRCDFDDGQLNLLVHKWMKAYDQKRLSEIL